MQFHLVPTPRFSVIETVAAGDPATGADAGEAARESTPVKTAGGESKTTPIPSTPPAPHGEIEEEGGGRVPKKLFRCGSTLRRAAKKALQVTDPWEKHNLHELPAERVRRHRYNGATKEWTVDDAIVKVQPEPFDEGAMRRCYRMKKLSQQPGRGFHALNWRDAANYVVKDYKPELEGITRDLPFEDVRVQAETTHWADLFSQCNPPKKICMIKSYVIEFVDRPGQPVLSVERYIQGEYIKYNSNSGFVDPEHRSTPQCFSHFTFEKSAGTLMVVDIQGVGDLYTDPQIHCYTPEQAAAANAGAVPETDITGDLGITGMALFFATHTCSALCRHMRLPPFDLSPAEQQRLAAPGGAEAMVPEGATRIGTVLRMNRSPDRPIVGAARSHSEGLGVVVPVTSVEVPEAPTAVALVHLELATFNRLGRFSERVQDIDSTMYHLFRAARGGSAQALTALGKGYLGLSHPLLPEEWILGPDSAMGVELLGMAGARGNCEAATVAGFAAKDGTYAERDPRLALDLLETAYANRSGSELPRERHEIAAAAAELNKELGNDEEAAEWYGSAAEEAMATMKMGLANKYLMLQSA